MKQKANVLGFNKAGREMTGRQMPFSLGILFGIAMIVVGFISLIFSVGFAIFMLVAGALILILSARKFKKIQDEYD